MNSQLGEVSLISAMPSRPAFNATTCPTCGQEIALDKLEEIGGRIAARDREQVLAITAQLEKQYALEKTRAESKAKADLEAEREQSAIRETRARDGSREGSRPTA